MKTDRTNALKQILSDVETDKNVSVLDVGCGNGETTFFLAENFKKVIGIDPQNESIEKAQKTYKKENLHFQVGQCFVHNGNPQSCNQEFPTIAT